MDLNHTITVMQDNVVKRVVCRTCRKEHGFKTSKGVKDPKVGERLLETKAKSTARKVAEEAISVQAEWEKLMDLHRNAPVRDYKASQPFNAGEKVNHKLFGAGFVMKAVYPNKIEVLFRDDLKVLIHQPQA
jgi:hypothetical protein